MNRRTFLRKTLAAGTALSLLPHLADARSHTNPLPWAPTLRYHGGKFRIVQFTDTHYIAGDPRSARALRNVCQMLDTEQPDLVIHTGDIIFGRPATLSLRQILAPMAERGIPWAVALGNHDGQFGLSRKQVYDYVRQLPGNINTPQKPGITGDSNDLILLTDAKGRPDRALWLLDTGDDVPCPGGHTWGTLQLDQTVWVASQARQLLQANGGHPVHSLLFQHIPVPEFNDALQAHRSDMLGHQGESVCCPNFNNGSFSRLIEATHATAMFCGHDHDNDYNLPHQGFRYIYGRFSGCDTVYNNLKPNGCRVIELTQGHPGFHTYIRLYGGDVEQG